MASRSGAAAGLLVVMLVSGAAACAGCGSPPTPSPNSSAPSANVLLEPPFSLGDVDVVTVTGLPLLAGTTDPNPVVHFGKDKAAITEVRAHVGELDVRLPANLPQAPTKVEVTVKWADKEYRSASGFLFAQPSDRGIARPTPLPSPPAPATPGEVTAAVFVGAVLSIVPILLGLMLLNRSLHRRLDQLPRPPGASPQQGISQAALDAIANSVSATVASEVRRRGEQQNAAFLRQTEQMQRVVDAMQQATERLAVKRSSPALPEPSFHIEPLEEERPVGPPRKPAPPALSRTNRPDSLVDAWNSSSGRGFAEAASSSGYEARPLGGFVLVAVGPGSTGTLLFPSHVADTGSVNFNRFFEVSGHGSRLRVSQPAAIDASHFRQVDTLDALPSYEVQKGVVHLE